MGMNTPRHRQNRIEKNRKRRNESRRHAVASRDPRQGPKHRAETNRKQDAR